MKKFSQCNNYHFKLYGMVIPKNSFYGKDDFSVWVYIPNEDTPEKRTELSYLLDSSIPCHCISLSLYRYSDKNMKWYKETISDETTDKIITLIRRDNLYKPVEYPKFTGIHGFSSKMNKANTRKKGVSTGKKNQRIYEQRHDHEQMHLSNFGKVCVHGSSNLLNCREIEKARPDGKSLYNRQAFPPVKNVKKHK